LLIDPKIFKDQAENYIRKWNLSPSDDPFSTHSSFLWPVLFDDQKAMLKIVREDDDEVHGAQILKFFDGHGSIRLIKDEGTVQLLERIDQPKNHMNLEQMVLAGQDDVATNIICDVIDKIHNHISGKTIATSHNFFSDRIEETERYISEGRVLADDIPMFKESITLSRLLLEKTESTHMLLHGDLHHFNVLNCPNRGWLSIDPKGIWGPRVYEYVIMLCNPTLQLNIVASTDRMNRQADIIAKKSNIDRDLIIQFTFIHALQVAAWCLSPPDKEYWLACGRTAKSIMA